MDKHSLGITIFIIIVTQLLKITIVGKQKDLINQNKVNKVNIVNTFIDGSYEW